MFAVVVRAKEYLSGDRGKVSRGVGHPPARRSERLSAKCSGKYLITKDEELRQAVK